MNATPFFSQTTTGLAPFTVNLDGLQEWGGYNSTFDSCWAAQITWGDGSSPASIPHTANDGSCTSNNAALNAITHTYQYPGTYALGVTFMSPTAATSTSLSATIVVTGATSTPGVPAVISFASITNKTIFYTGLYNCILGRAPGTLNDPTGLSYWVSSSGVTTLYEAYESFFGSAEYIADGTSNQLYLNQLYQCVLYRQPGTNGDSSGYNYWLNALNGGMSRASVLLSFINDNEFQTLIGPALQKATGLSYNGQTSVSTPSCPAGSTGTFPVCYGVGTSLQTCPTITIPTCASGQSPVTSSYQNYQGHICPAAEMCSPTITGN